MLRSERTVLCLEAHPDDAEFLCAGTLALLRQRGWQVHIASVTPGDCGTVQYHREEISRIRKAEAAKAAAMLDGGYHCLEADDAFIMYDRPTLTKAIAVVREVRPTIVLTLSPSDYMVDHETASRLAQSACFCCGVINIATPGAEGFEPIPHLYYADAMEGKDTLGREIRPSMVVDITGAMDTKEKMLCCHESQRDWLLKHHGMDEYVAMMKSFSADRGRLAGVSFGEGFRQHLGHAFPQDNILQKELGNLVHVL
ncbi:MAG: PIG-L family deacetylase [Planctomycetes bacterium]|nr:PIG-L family deacetylase [Planctomycetota bacterium]